MHYANFGLAFGFICISLVIPLEFTFPEQRVSGQEKLDSKPPEPSPSCSIPSKECRSPTQGMWTHVLTDIDLMDRTFREQLRGYRRITANNVLVHKTRRKIFDLIRQYPGIDLTRLSEIIPCNEHTLRYHIDRIAKEKWISVFDKEKSYYFFENHNAFSPEEQRFLSNFSSGQTSKILQLIHNYPGITRKELANHLEVASPTVTRSVQHLTDDGYILLVKDGKFTRHYLHNESLAIIQKINNV